MLKKLVFLLVLVGLIFSPETSACRHRKRKKAAQQTLIKSSSIPGRIIFVNGSCSSGKSSISKILAQKLDAQMFAFDEIVMPKVLRKFIVKHYGAVLGFIINGV